MNEGLGRLSGRAATLEGVPVKEVDGTTDGSRRGRFLRCGGSNDGRALHRDTGRAFF